MPLMTKMRDSMPIVFAGLAAVFLLMIIFQWGGQGTLFEQKGQAGVLGTVNGYPITQEMYNKVLQNVTDQMKQKAKVTELSETDQATAEDQAWDQAIGQAITDQSIAKMGITVTDQEVRDMLFNNPPANIRGQFTDSASGRFNQEAYIKALRDPRNDSIVRVMEGQTRDQLKNLKWQQAMAGTVRVTDTEAYIRFMTDSAKAMLQVIKLQAPQATPQMASMISPAEIQAYYNAHTWMYRQDEQRKFKFVGFPLIPNARDTANVMETAASLKARLAEAPINNIDTVAKELADDYSDMPYQPRHVVSMRELGDDTSLFAAKTGDAVVAKITDIVTVVRVLDEMDTSRELYHLRHITIGFPQGGTVAPSQQAKDSTLAVAQQVLQQLQSGASFAELARTRSADPRSALKGGDMGWIDTMMFPPNFRAPVAKAAPGSIVGPIESPRGYDLIKVEASSRKAWLVVGVPLTVKPSHQTLEIKSQSANLFRDNAAKVGFDQAAKAAGYRVISDAPPVTRKGSPIFSSHEFVDWCFESAKGEISTAFNFQGIHAIIVAQLTDITPAGPKPLEAVKSDIAQTLALRKAVAALEGRAQQVRAMIGANGDLAAVATQTGDQTLAPLTVLMGPAESVNGIPTGEYVVNNWAYSAQPGTISPPLKGEHGYYIAKLIGRNIPSQQEFEKVKPAIVQQIQQEKEQRLLMDWLDTQKQSADIEDYRFKH